MNARTRVCALTLAALVLPLALSAPITFRRTFGGTNVDKAWSALQTADGGYVFAGYTWSFGSGLSDLWVVKTTPLGDMEWNKTYGSAHKDEGNSVRQTADGGYAVVGNTTASNWVSNVWLIRLDPNGNTLWSRAYGGPEPGTARSVQQTPDGGYIIVGHTASRGAGKYDIWLIKTDSVGETLWTRTYGGPEDDFGYDVELTVDNGYALVGRTNSFGAGRGDAWLLKTDPNGDTLWTRTYGGNDIDYGNSVQQTSNGGYILCGHTASDAQHDLWLVRTDSAGDTVWTRHFGGDDFEEGLCARQTPEGGFAAVGYNESFDLGAWLLKTDANGDTVWSRTYTGPYYVHGNSLWLCNDGGYAVAGYADNFVSPWADAVLIKTDSLGYVGVAEPPEQKPLPDANATILGATYLHSGTGRAELVDATGRKVMSLVPGTNDIRALPAGVYSVISPSAAPVRILKPR